MAALVDYSNNRGTDELVIFLPHHLLQVIARTILLAAAILSFPWLSTVIYSSSSEFVLTTRMASQGIDDDPFDLPVLLPDLVHEGVVSPKGHGIFVGELAGSLAPFMKKNRIEAVSRDNWRNSVCEHSVDFVVSAESNAYSVFERVLRVGGVAVQIVSSDPANRFRLPENYMIVYVRKFRSTVVAIKKLSHAAKLEVRVGGDNTRIQAGRRLLAVPKSKRELLNGLEGVLLEPPIKNSKLLRKFRRSTRFFPDLIGVSLDEYPRRVLIHLGSPLQESKNSKLFENWYPKRNSNFDVIRLDTNVMGKNALLPEGVSEWLRRNVKEEEFVVMKAEAEVVEEMMKEKVIGLVDELFIECKNQWQEGLRRSSRAYWECLTLYGRLRDEGIAVHQWWS